MMDELVNRSKVSCSSIDIENGVRCARAGSRPGTGGATSRTVDPAYRITWADTRTRAREREHTCHTDIIWDIGVRKVRRQRR